MQLNRRVARYPFSSHLEILESRGMENFTAIKSNALDAAICIRRYCNWLSRPYVMQDFVLLPSLPFQDKNATVDHIPFPGTIGDPTQNLKLKSPLFLLVIS